MFRIHRRFCDCRAHTSRRRRTTDRGQKVNAPDNRSTAKVLEMRQSTLPVRTVREASRPLWNVLEVLRQKNSGGQAGETMMVVIVQGVKSVAYYCKKCGRACCRAK